MNGACVVPRRPTQYGVSSVSEQAQDAVEVIRSLKTRFINMEADFNHKRSASCFSQLEPTRKEGRRSAKAAGRKDTTRRGGTAENCEVQNTVSERMTDMHRKVRLGKVLGAFSCTKRGPSVALRSKPAIGGDVLQKSTKNIRLQPPACRFATIGTVLLNILKRPMLQQYPLSTATIEMVLYHSSTAFQKPLRYGYTIRIPTTSDHPVLYVLQKRNSPASYTSKQAAGRRHPVPGSSSIWEKSAGSAEQ